MYREREESGRQSTGTISSLNFLLQRRRMLSRLGPFFRLVSSPTPTRRRKKVEQRGYTFVELFDWSVLIELVMRRDGCFPIGGSSAARLM